MKERGRAGWILLVALVVEGCQGKREAVLTGQVFIVGQSGASTKLSLVTIAAIPDSTIRRFLAQRESQARLESARCEREVARAESLLGVALGRAESLRSRAERLNAGYIKGGVTTEQWMGREVGIREADAQVEAERNALDSAKWALGYANSGSYYIDFGVPDSVAVAQTDADGHFTLRLPERGEFVLAARAVPVEGVDFIGRYRYHWLIRLPEAVRHGGNILLSNDNLMSSASPLSVKRVERE